MFSSKSLSSIKRYVRDTDTYLSSHLSDFSDQIQLMTGQPSPIEFSQNHYRYQIIIKCQPSITEDVKQRLEGLPSLPRYVRRFIE